MSHAMNEPLSPPARPEFSRPIDIRTVDGRRIDLTAGTEECAALARRFGLVAIDRLTASVELAKDGENVTAEGRLGAAIVQSCAVSGEDLPVAIDEPLALRFVPARAAHRPDEEVEITADECDEIEFAGTSIDLGEAVAQSLALAIDPFATGTEAERIRSSGLLGEEPAGPFAALAALKPDRKP